jgi:hypothetical protein
MDLADFAAGGGGSVGEWREEKEDGQSPALQSALMYVSVTLVPLTLFILYMIHYGGVFICLI